jgi:Flp pilus assembly protein TadG
VTRSDDGQALPLMCMLLVLILGIIGLAVDLGRVYVTRAQLSRSLDAAALAGVIELPNTTAATSKSLAYMNANMPSATNVSAVPDVANQKVTMSANAGVNTLFMKILGINTVSVHADAEAGASNSSSSALPLDIAMLLDDTGTMRSGCTVTQVTVVSTNQSSPVCPIGLTRNAAKDFIDVLAPGGVLPASTNIGFLSFRACYANTNINPRNEPDDAATAPWNHLRGCVKFSDTIALSNSVAAIKPKIDTMQGAGGYPGTNLCLGMARAYKTLTGSGAQAGARKVMIILTDGENRYSDFAHQDVAVADSQPTTNRHLANQAPNTYPTTNDSPQTNGAPPADATVDSCYPAGSTYNQDTTAYGTDYDKRTNYLDVHTIAQVDAMKAAGVEIYVVGFGVNGAADPGTTCDAAMKSRIGTYSGRDVTGSGDTQGDRELAKCMASSKTGTNDHYFESNATGLSTVFTHIATQISFRLVK